MRALKAGSCALAEPPIWSSRENTNQRQQAKFEEENSAYTLMTGRCLIPLKPNVPSSDRSIDLPSTPDSRNCIAPRTTRASVGLCSPPRPNVEDCRQEGERKGWKSAPKLLDTDPGRIQQGGEGEHAFASAPPHRYALKCDRDGIMRWKWHRESA